MSWTVVQWCRIVHRTVVRLGTTDPVSIIHANVGSECSWASLRVARRHQIPCVVTYQGSEAHQILRNRRKGWRLCVDSFRLADLNLPVSRSLELSLREYSEPMGSCYVLRRGVNHTRFYPPLKRPCNPKALFVRNVHSAKGVFEQLSAWTQVRYACPDATLTLVGPDFTGGLAIRRAHALGISDSISLTGPLPSAQVAELMRTSRVLCLPSHAEGTPNCVMEAMACGLPVVATAVGGIPEILTHGETGLLVETGNINTLANALITLLNSPDKCVQMGDAAAAFARAYLDARRTVDRLVETYQGLLANRRKIA